MASIEADFSAWNEYAGELAYYEDSCGASRLHAWHAEAAPLDVRVRDDGGAFVFVYDGELQLQDAAIDWRLTPGQWAALSGGFQGRLAAGSRAAVFQKLGYHGLRAMGGPIEEFGRLRYIDGCSDTLLACPPLLGDPCLNHLHFPANTVQSEHTHPSVRLGMVVRGAGICRTPAGDTELKPGLVFCVPTGGRHGFLTDSISMDVIAYHPDSDWGPTDQDHPMVNRTLVDGQKIDNTTWEHARAVVVGR
jgi:uncharacterized cupin superfamily protein